MDVQEKPVCISSMVNNGWNSAPCWTPLESMEFLLLWAIIKGQLSHLYVQVAAVDSHSGCAIGLVAVVVLLCLVGHIKQHPLNQGATFLGLPSGTFLCGTSSFQGLTFSLSKEMPNIPWRLMHMEAKSCSLQCLCTADLFRARLIGARLCLWPLGTRCTKSPFSESDCHLCCFQCWSSLCSGCFSPGLISFRATNHHAAIVGVSCFSPQEYPERHTSKYCLKFLQSYC